MIFHAIGVNLQHAVAIFVAAVEKIVCENVEDADLAPRHGNAAFFHDRSIQVHNDFSA